MQLEKGSLQNDLTPHIKILFTLFILLAVYITFLCFDYVMLARSTVRPLGNVTKEQTRISSWDGFISNIKRFLVNMSK